MTHWIGLTGGIGSGKTAVSDCFLQWGVPVVDADEISRNLTAEGGSALPALRAIWGDALFLPSGQLNRAYLREVIFASADEKDKLEKVLHPMILAQIQERQQQETAAYGIVSVPLLAELPIFLALVERVLVVDCAIETQIERVKVRSQLSDEQVLAIMAQQANRQERLQIADDVIVNESDWATLEQSVRLLNQQYQAEYSGLP